MENVFSGLSLYGSGSWSVIGSRSFSADEVAAVRSAVVVNGEYGKSVCFYMNAGGQTYIPLSNNSTLSAGDSVDVSKATLLTLHKEGESDILRVEA